MSARSVLFQLRELSPCRRAICIHRIAYQIWWLINDTAGECTLRDMAAFTGASVSTCRNICSQRDWVGRYRKTKNVSAQWETSDVCVRDLGVEFV